MNILTTSLPLYAFLLLLFAAIFVFCIVFIKNHIKQKNTHLLIRMISHDIRSPLTNIKGYADALREGIISDDKIDESLALVSSEADRLSRIVSRISENGKFFDLTLTAFGICDVCRRTMMLNEKSITHKNVDLNFEFPDDEIYVFADFDSICEALYNIVSNAAKYVSDGGRITISAKQTENFAEIKVINTFLGEEPDKNKVFKAGYRDKNVVKNTYGQGLGLYVAQKIIIAHGEKISFSSQNDECVVAFRLKLAN